MVLLIVVGALIKRRTLLPLIVTSMVVVPRRIAVTTLIASLRIVLVATLLTSSSTCTVLLSLASLHELESLSILHCRSILYKNIANLKSTRNNDRNLIKMPLSLLLTLIDLICSL